MKTLDTSVPPHSAPLQSAAVPTAVTPKAVEPNTAPRGAATDQPAARVPVSGSAKPIQGLPAGSALGTAEVDTKAQLAAALTAAAASAAATAQQSVSAATSHSSSVREGQQVSSSVQDVASKHAMVQNGTGDGQSSSRTSSALQASAPKQSMPQLATATLNHDALGASSSAAGATAMLTKPKAAAVSAKPAVLLATSAGQPTHPAERPTMASQVEGAHLVSQQLPSALQAAVQHTVADVASPATLGASAHAFTTAARPAATPLVSAVLSSTAQMPVGASPEQAAATKTAAGGTSNRATAATGAMLPDDAHTSSAARGVPAAAHTQTAQDAFPSASAQIQHAQSAADKSKAASGQAQHTVSAVSDTLHSKVNLMPRRSHQDDSKMALAQAAAVVAPVATKQSARQKPTVSQKPVLHATPGTVDEALASLSPLTVPPEEQALASNSQKSTPPFARAVQKLKPQAADAIKSVQPSQGMQAGVHAPASSAQESTPPFAKAVQRPKPESAHAHTPMQPLQGVPAAHSNEALPQHAQHGVSPVSSFQQATDEQAVLLQNSEQGTKPQRQHTWQQQQQQQLLTAQGDESLAKKAHAADASQVPGRSSDRQQPADSSRSAAVPKLNLAQVRFCNEHLRCMLTWDKFECWGCFCRRIGVADLRQQSCMQG